jgi:allophanate hydrolase
MPPRPGLLRVDTTDADGAAIEVEIWRLPLRHYGGFVAGIAAPLGIGTLILEDGSRVQGFLCESQATANAKDITRFGGWRAYMRQCHAA